MTRMNEDEEEMLREGRAAAAGEGSRNGDRQNCED